MHICKFGCTVQLAICSGTTFCIPLPYRMVISFDSGAGWANIGSTMTQCSIQSKLTFTQTLTHRRYTILLCAWPCMVTQPSMITWLSHPQKYQLLGTLCFCTGCHQFGYDNRNITYNQNSLSLSDAIINMIDVAWF